MGGHWPSLDTIATGQTAVVAVLLVTQFVPQPHVSSGVADLGGLAYGVPLASFVVMAVSLAAGFGMLLTGASRSGARLRYGVLAVVTLLLAIQPVIAAPRNHRHQPRQRHRQQGRSHLHRPHDRGNRA